MNYENQRGRSMIEMLGVLAIIGVLSVGGIAGYSKAMNKFKTNKIADNISMIVANIRTLYAQQKNFSGLDNKTAISMGIIPDELGTDANSGELTNAFNGSVYVTACQENKNDPDQRAFAISFNNLSKEACIALATNDWGSSYSSGLIALRVDLGPMGESSSDLAGIFGHDNYNVGCEGGHHNTNSTHACPGGKTISVPMPVTEAVAGCQCNTGNTCSIGLKFH
ncbi:MAG: type 4 pilus major pilin [Pseudomonadota bacterium]|nr:type 4 pilus major pilin [Pseudomonadota bacterium]